MRKRISVILFILIVLLQFIVSSCSKEEELKYIPELTTSDITSVTSNTVSISSSVVDNGNDKIVERGVCWDTSTEPTILKNKTVDGRGVGNYNSTIPNLSTNTQYYFRAYATNSVGTAYGSLFGIKTLPGNVTSLTDAINIVSVTPIADLQGGESYTFEVIVVYKLGTLQTGTIMIGFNNTDNYNTARIITDAEKIVNQGNGEHTFKATAMVKDWDSESDFTVYVNLSENPLPERFTPLAVDRFILIPKDTQ